MKVISRAHPNIALIKYWGKRDPVLNLPDTGSLSVTVGDLFTEVVVEASPHNTDLLLIEGQVPSAAEATRMVQLVRHFRTLMPDAPPLKVDSYSNFPRAAGLASSASASAALSLGLDKFLGLRLSRQVLSTIARQFSGSGSRSLHGGFVEWRRGELPDGSDSFAVPLAPASFWPLTTFVLVVDPGPKEVGSRDGMNQSRATSPTYPSFVIQNTADLEVARQALQDRDLALLSTLSERSCLGMVATQLTSQPPLYYWQGTTFSLITSLRRLRQEGLALIFTTDAGPNVKVFCEAATTPILRQKLSQLPGVKQLLECPVGGPATVEMLP